MLLYEIGGEDDESWRNSTLFSIYRKIIQLKRDPHISTFSDSLGLIAYAESFEKISKDESCTNLPGYHGKETADSIRATQVRVEREASLRQRRIDIFRNTIIAVAGVLFSFMGLLKLSSYTSKVTPNPILTESLDWILLYPIQSVAILIVLVGTTIQLFTFRNSDVSSLSIRVIRWVQFVRREIVAGALFILGLASLYVAWQLLP